MKLGSKTLSLNFNKPRESLAFTDRWYFVIYVLNGLFSKTPNTLLFSYDREFSYMPDIYLRILTSFKTLFNSFNI